MYLTRTLRVAGHGARRGSKEPASTELAVSAAGLRAYDLRSAMDGKERCHAKDCGQRHHFELRAAGERRAADSDSVFVGGSCLLCVSSCGVCEALYVHL